MSESIATVVELVGSSDKGWQEAVEVALQEAIKTFSGGMKDAQPTTGVTSKLLEHFAHTQRQGILQASETELRRSSPNVA